MELHGCRGCGSTAVEALLEMAGMPYRRQVFEWDDRDAWDRLRGINPLAQVPTLGRRDHRHRVGGHRPVDRRPAPAPAAGRGE